ncbi:hypothetical protein [Labilibaculum sp.]|uniref:hypothetical protein n=1 Tax=Labilibaculum sp. TaxID=2060723 RepID=UPI003561DEE4
MKRITLFLILSFIVTSSFAQKQLQEHFKKDLINYTSAFNNKEWNTLTQMMYPPMFEMMSKENMVQGLEQMDKIGVNMTTDFKSIDNVSEVVVNGSEKYCKIQYYGIINIKLSGLMSQGSLLLQSQFENEFGKENVTYKEENNSFTIHAHRSMLAISHKNSDDWKYIDVDSPKAKGLKKLIPEKVQQQFN